MSDSLGSNEKPESLPTSQEILKPPRLVLDNTETTSQASGAMQNGEPESKKAHLDDDKDDDKTSTYDVSDDEDMGDDAPFTVVTYKKKRAEGIPVVFRPTEEGTSFWHVNPNRVSTEIVSAAKEKVQSFRTTRDGSFSVSVTSLASAKRLLMLTNVGGLEVKPFIPESYTRNVRKVRHVPLQYTDGQLLDYLKESGVISARRQVKYYRQEDGAVMSRPLHTVILTFRDDRPIPGRIYLGFTSHPVEEYLGPALRCYNCQRFGHMAKSCRSTRRCKICSEDHHHKECKSVLQPKCANCAGNHAASYSGCPQNKAAAQLRRHELIHGRQPRRNEAPPNLDIVHPAQGQQHQRTPESQRPREPSRDPPREPTGVQPRAQSRGSQSVITTYASKLQIPKRQQAEETSRQPQRPQVFHPEAAPVDGAHTTASVTELILPMLFAALKAILSALPEANNLPEVQALLPLEALLCHQSRPSTRQSVHE